jgi:adenylate kinase family enzyme
LVQCRKKGAANYGNKNESVAEGSTPNKGDEVYFRNRLVGRFLGYGRNDKVIVEPNEDEMGDEYVSGNVYWDKDAVTIKPARQGVAEGSLEEGVNDPHIFKAIAMIGPMGAGKSTIAQQLVGGSGLRSLNLDNFNELLIKQGKVAGGNLTPDQLERSWQLTQAQKGNWVDGRLGLLIDGSGRNVEGLVKPLMQLEALGYDTMVILVNVSLETSLQRQQSRAAQQAQQYGTGRNVPADLAKSSYDQIQQNIPKLQQLYGNKLLIINNEGSVDLTQEKTIVDRFLSAPPSKPAAVEWIKSQGASQGQQLDKRLAQQQRQQSSAQRAPTYKQQGVAEEQELDEKWSQKYKSSINCANPKGFSQKAHCAGRKKNEDVEESLGKQIHSTFQSMGDSFSDAHLAKGISYFLQGRHQEGENWLRGKIPQAAQDTVFSKLRTLQAQGGVDVNKNANVQQYIDDKLVPWVKNQIQQNVKEGVMYGAENLHVGDDVIVSGDVNLKGTTGVIDSFGQDKRFVVVDLYNHGKHSFHSSDVSANDHDNDEHDDLDETRRGQVPMTLKPGETDNLEPEDSEGFKKLPAYKQGQQAQQSRGKDLIQQSPYTYQSDQDWAYRNGAFDAQQAAASANFAKRGPLTTAEGEQQKGADYRDPKEVDYDDEYDAMVARVKRLAGIGPMQTVYDRNKRQYRNMPTAVQPKK